MWQSLWFLKINGKWFLSGQTIRPVPTTGIEVTALLSEWSIVNTTVGQMTRDLAGQGVENIKMYQEWNMPLPREIVPDMGPNNPDV